MIKSRTAFIPLLLGTAFLAGCGGGDGSGVVEQTEEIAVTATDTATETATDLASDANDAVADTANAITDALDPAAWQDIEMDWDNQVSSVQQAFPDLSVDEITGTAGKPENMVSLIEQKYGITREEAQAKVSEWASSL